MKPFVAKLLSAGELSGEERDLLINLCDHSRLVPARRDIIGEGEQLDRIHLMLEGWSCRYQLLDDGSRQIISLLLPGDFCDPFITPVRAMDHAIGTLTQARVALITRDRMAELAHRPRVARVLRGAGLVEAAVLRAWIVNLGRRDATARIAHLICELHVRLRTIGLARESSFELPLTQEELSDALGLTPVHVNRVLKRLRESGLMTFRRQQIDIVDVPALRALAGFRPGYLHLDSHDGGLHEDAGSST